MSAQSDFDLIARQVRVVAARLHSKDRQWRDELDRIADYADEAATYYGRVNA